MGLRTLFGYAPVLQIGLETHKPIVARTQVSVDRIVILLADSIEFVIVTACTCDRHPQKRLAENIDHIVESIRLVFASIDR